MNKLKIIAITLLISLSGIMYSQTNYESKMQQGLKQITNANSENEFSASSIFFSDLAKAEKSNWLPYYYAGFCKAIVALKFIKAQQTKADALCNEADYFIKKSDSLNPNNSEVYVLKSMVLSARLNVNPQGRALKYNKQIIKANNTAIKLNETNPRSYLQKAQATYYTPEAFGGGKKKALPLFELALEKFKTFKPETNLMPKWGKEIAVEMIEKCKE